MSKESDHLKGLRDASIKTAAAHLRNIHRLRQAVNGPNAAQPAPAARQRDIEQATRVSDLLFDSARLNLNTYNELLDLGSRMTDQVIDSVRSVLRRKDTPADRQTIIATSGAAGGDALVRFHIENRLASDAEVTLTVSEFAATEGGARFAPQFGFRAEGPSAGTAGERTLGANEVRTFQMTLQLDQRFEAGKQYAGEIHVVMGGRIAEVLQVVVDVRA